MSSPTLNISLTGRLKEYVEAQANSGRYGTPDEFVRELIEDDKDRQLSRLEAHLIEALRSDELEITEEELRGGSLVSLLKEKLAAKSAR